MKNFFLRLPFAGDFPVSLAFGTWPQEAAVVKKFREWGIIGHHGIDFALPLGTQVLAANEGQVVYAGENGEWGLTVTLSHPWGESMYAHLSQCFVSKGQAVAIGELIASSGQTGTAFGPHLHFGIKPVGSDPNNGYLGFVDPSPFFVQTENASRVSPEAIPSAGELLGETIPQESSSPPLPKETLAQLRSHANEARRKKKERRRTEILKLAHIAPVQSRDIQNHFNVSRQTAYIDLSALVSNGLLTKTGKGPGTLYVVVR